MAGESTGEVTPPSTLVWTISTLSWVQSPHQLLAALAMV